MAKHSQESKNFKKVFIVLMLALCCIVFFVINIFSDSLHAMYQMSFGAKITEKTEEHEISKTDIRSLYGASYLHSNNFSLTVKDGITTINATITNNSTENINDLKCLYSLIDSSNNIVYSFDISINSIEANSSSSFACMAILDLSTVVDYSVSLIEQ